MANVSNDERFRMHVYKIRGDQFKADINSFAEFLKEKPAPSRDFIELQLERLEKKYNTFEEIYNKLKLDKDSEIEHNQIFDLYVDVIAEARILLELLSDLQFPKDSAESTDGREANEAEPSQMCEVVMEYIHRDLPHENPVCMKPSYENPVCGNPLGQSQFNGQKTQWSSFFNWFKNIAESNDLDDSEKLKKLQSTVTGKVKTVVDKYEDFGDAWNDLKEAYDDTKGFVIKKASLLHSSFNVSENSKTSILNFIYYMDIYPKWLQALTQTEKDFMRLYRFSLAIGSMDDETRKNYINKNTEKTPLQQLCIEDIFIVLQRKLISLQEKNNTSRNREMPGTSNELEGLWSLSRKRQAMDA